jgi:hypothetical protein
VKAVITHLGPPFGKPLSLLRAYAFLRPYASTK